METGKRGFKLASVLSILVHFLMPGISHNETHELFDFLLHGALSKDIPMPYTTICCQAIIRQYPQLKQFIMPTFDLEPFFDNKENWLKEQIAIYGEKLTLEPANKEEMQIKYEDEWEKENPKP